MHKLLVFIKLGITDAFEYRLDVLGFVIGGLARPIILLAVWSAVLLSSSSVPATRDEIIQYYLLLLLINPFISAWAGIFIADDIRTGKISSLLIKPFPFIYQVLGNNIGEKVIKLSYLIPIIAVLFIIFDQKIPTLSFYSFLAFVVSLLMAAAINFLMNFCIGISAFWTDEVRSLEDGVDLFNYIFSGRLFPLYLLPLFWQEVAAILPFRYTLSLPIEILQSKLTETEMLYSLAIQLGWLVFFILLYKVMWLKGVKRYSAFAN